MLLLGVSIIVYDTGSVGSNFTELLSFRSLFCVTLIDFSLLKVGVGSTPSL